MIAEYISANQFRVEEDRTGEFKTGRRIKAYCGVDGYVYSTILSSSYSDPYTTITIVENVLTSNLEDVLYGIVNIGETGAFPDHLHDGTEGQGGALPHITTTEFSTYSGTLQTQIDNKPDTFLELTDTPSFYDSGKYARSTSSGIVWATAGQTFLDLTDTPTTYSGHTGKHLKVTSSGIDFIQLPAYNMFTAASGLPVSGNPLDSYLNFNTGDIYAYALGASFYNNTKFNIASMPHAASRTLSGAASNVSDGSTLTFWQDDINTNQWVSIDLGASKNIWKICLTGYQAYDTRMPNNFRIEASSDNSNWNTIYTGIAVSNSSIDQFFIFPTPSPPYRYWRLYVIDNWGDTWLLLSKFELYEGYESNSYSWQVRGNITPSFIKLTDAPHTYADSVGKYPQSTGSGIAWATPIIVENRIPVATDGIVNNIFIDSLHNDVYKKVVETSATTVNYWRLYISVCNDTYCDISTFELRPTVGGADQAYNSGGTATSNSFWGAGYDASKVFDNDSGSSWSTGVVNPCWIQYQFTTAKSVSEIYLKPRSGFLSRMPRDFKLQCSSDGANWQDRGSWTNQTNWLDAGRTFYIDTLYSGWDIVLDTKNSFNELLDAPSTYSGTTGKFAQSTGSGIVWTAISGSYWYNGDSTPSGSLGVVNDYYINSTTNKIYKKQISGSPFFTAKSVIIDMTNNWSDSNYVGLRSVELYLSGSKVSTPLSALTGYDTSSSFDPVHAFKNEVVKTGQSLTSNGWTSDPSSTTNQRIVCVFSSPVTFDSIVINNYHHSGGITARGAKDINVYYSTDTITTATYGGVISNSTLIFTGQLHQHAASDIVDNQTLTLISNYSTNWNVVLNTVNNFSGLVDTPSTYSGTLGMFAQSTGSGIVWTTVSAGSSDIQTFLDLTDTPNEYSEGLFAQSTASGIVWATASGSSAQTFIELTDTPSSYAGQEGKFVKVVGNALEFATVSGLGGSYDSSWFFELDENGGLMPSTGSGILDVQSFLDLTDTPNTYSDGLYAKSTASGIVWATVSGSGSSDVQTFLDLIDVPSTYSGTVGKFAQSTGSGIVWSDVQSGPPTSGTWNFEEATLSGTGDVYCGDIYLNNLRLSSDGDSLIVEKTTIVDTGIDAFTSLILHMDGANGSTIFTDSSINSISVTANADIKLSTNAYKFGNTSALFDGVGDQLTFPMNSAFNFGSGDFTVDCWFKFNSIPTGNLFNTGQYILSNGPNNSGPGLDLILGSTLIRFNLNDYNSITVQGAYIPDTSWHHFALVRNGTTFTLYLDGVSIGSNTSSATMTTWTGLWSIGRCEAAGENTGYFNGYIDEYRISKGVARWTSNFTPPSTAYYVDLGSFSKELSYTDHVHSFTDLIDAPHTYSGTVGKFAQSTGSGIVWATVSGGSGASSFIDLTDTPNSYSNGKFAQSTEDGIVWTTVSGGGTGTSYGELELTYASDIVLDFTEYNLQSVILTGNTNFTFTNMTNGKPCVLNVIQDAQGSRAATFQSGIKWPQGVIPTTSSGSGLYDIFTFIQSRGTICGSCSAAFQLGS